MGRSVCAWCGKDKGHVPNIPPGQVTHGICKPCKEKLLAKSK